MIIWQATEDKRKSPRSSGIDPAHLADAAAAAGLGSQVIQVSCYLATCIQYWQKEFITWLHNIIIRPTTKFADPFVPDFSCAHILFSLFWYRSYFVKFSVLSWPIKRLSCPKICGLWRIRLVLVCALCCTKTAITCSSFFSYRPHADFELM